MKVPYQRKSIRKELTNTLQSWRFIVVYVFFSAIFLWLVTRIAFLQVVSPEYYISEADKRSKRVQTIAPTRGMITDREGRPLAVSIPVKAIWLDPKFILEQGGVKQNEKWQALSEVVGIPLVDIAAKVSGNPKSRFVYIARQVSIEKADYIRKLNLPGIGFNDEAKRYYPTGNLVSQIVGITNLDGEGIEGIELSFEKWLQGVPGERTIRKDKYGRVIENIETVDSQSGQNLVLSIDERLQNILFREISKAVEVNRAEAGTAVLLDVQTGEVLAMASAPTYNPNSKETSKAEFKRNRAITDVFEPGSTVKPLVVMAGLENGVIQPTTVLNTMPFMINGKQIKDVSRQAELSITGILQKSSNTGVSRIALQMDPNVLVNTYKSFGFGQSTQLGLVGEQAGLYPNKKQRWSDIERATFSFGYGLMITPLQLAKAYATIGSYGIARPVSITRVDPPVSGEQVFPTETVKTVLHMMETVTHPGGGGVKAAVKDYRVAVKTGTAKKVENGVYVDKYIAYTAGIAPVSNPKFSLVVVLNEPSAGEYFGGAVSAPVFSSIMGGVLRTMGIAPDGIDLSIEDSRIVVNSTNSTADKKKAAGG